MTGIAASLASNLSDAIKQRYLMPPPRDLYDCAATGLLLGIGLGATVAAVLTSHASSIIVGGYVFCFCIGFVLAFCHYTNEHSIEAGETYYLLLWNMTLLLMPLNKYTLIVCGLIILIMAAWFTFVHSFSIATRADTTSFFGNILSRWIGFLIVFGSIGFGITYYLYTSDVPKEALYLAAVFMSLFMDYGQVHMIRTMRDYSLCLYSEQSEPDAQTDKHNSNTHTAQAADLCAAEYNLTEREKEILLLMFCRYDNENIARKLFISMSTTKTHVANIYNKLGIHSRKELIDIKERLSK